MIAGLVAAGLFQSEATAMVETWWDSYFAVDGLRVFWVVPVAKTDAILPLEVSPAPDKIVRVIKKQDEKAPHAVLLVLDATTGQNAMAQADIFTKVAGVTGLIMTKLDGTARGGILVAIAERFRIPVHAIGVGEKIEDLQPFDAQGFARAIAGLEEA